MKIHEMCLEYHLRPDDDLTKEEVIERCKRMAQHKIGDEIKVNDKVGIVCSCYDNEFVDAVDCSDVCMYGDGNCAYFNCTFPQDLYVKEVKNG